MENIRIENAKITSTSISMADHGVLTFDIALEGDGWGVFYGNYVIGHGYLGADEFSAENGDGLVAMMHIMNTVGVDKWESLPGKFVRVENKGWGKSVTKIGHLIEDKWFDIDKFFKEKRKENGIE